MSNFSFNENYAAEFDAVDSRAIEFPFEELIARLDGIENEADRHREKMAQGLIELLRFFAGNCLKKESGITDEDLRQAGLRMLAALWTLDPSLYDGSPSAAKLSARLGLNRGAVSTRATEFTARYGIQNRAQSHGRAGAHADRLHRTEDRELLHVKGE